MRMELKFKVIDKIPAELKIRLDKFSDENWGEHVDSDDERRSNLFDNDKSAVVARVNKKLVGLLFIHFRKIKFDNKTVKLGGVGGVVVDKNLRRKGIATALLKRAILEMKKKGVDISMLGTDIDKLEGLYAKAGFTRLGRPYYFINIKGEQKTENGGMIAPVKSNEIFNFILRSGKKVKVGISNF